SAEYQLKRILWALRHQGERLNTRFARLVQLNLDRVAAARHSGIVFGDEILALHGTPELIPAEAVQAVANEQTLPKREWLFLHLEKIWQDPFRHLPQAATFALNAAPSDPWIDSGSGTEMH